MPQTAQFVLDVMRDFMGYNIGRREIPTCRSRVVKNAVSRTTFSREGNRMALSPHLRRHRPTVCCL